MCVCVSSRSAVLTIKTRMKSGEGEDFGDMSDLPKQGGIYQSDKSVQIWINSHGRSAFV